MKLLETIEGADGTATIHFSARAHAGRQFVVRWHGVIDRVGDLATAQKNANHYAGKVSPAKFARMLAGAA